jgi:hypothetical protein
MKDLKYEEIYPKIFVYSNMFKDVNEVLNTLKESIENPEGSAIGPWTDWYTFGLETSYYDWSKDSERARHERSVYDEVNQVFFDVTEHYADMHGVDIKPQKIINSMGHEVDSWRKMGPSSCKYDAEAGVTTELAMHYHTDYQVEFKDSRGYNFALTVTTYLNDDYDGGEIDFLVNGKLISHKPKAGDVVVFPAGDPNFLTEGEELYHHGVKKVHNGSKYFIRANWQKYYEGSDEWNRNADIYGLEIWLEMEKEKAKQDRKNGKYQTINEIDVEKAVRIK